MITPKVFTVSQLNSRIANLISSDQELKMIFIEGELSNVNINAKSGHLYFSLKDKDSVIRAVMFSWSVRNLKFRPAAGMKVIMRAQVTVYEPGGQYQLRVEDMQPDGVGVRALQLEELKQKLDKEGLFDPAHKKPIPAFPKTVGIITSPTGAALRDIMDIIGRRYPCVDLVLAPVLVQGEEAPAQLIRAVDLFSEHKAADVIIIGRGGGSAEDLWAFNDEGLARAIYRCEIPVISAVGHETDTTICDFVSDLRAPTPSAAAELAVPNRVDLLENVQNLLRQSIYTVNKQIDIRQQDAEKLSELVSAYSPLESVIRDRELVDSFAVRASNAANHGMDSVSARSKELFTKVEALNPIAVLNRGFAYITQDDNNVSSVHDVKSGDIIDVRLKDGSFSAKVE
ncbi:MAG: exodeoxyribonuclease VII large subunit [Ruminococcus sp.]|uniref:exodeoxyribonuclease VII large subunit n=1 Tax=Ruminococcus sp. TaxID=41978 RepID=UPI002873AA9A|nr:exodeoxyribonuclease VII large subunit [Ruminococcus sp.]MBQ3284026.1 exodeoxyribonuclease VII large subunit [Ruminococcus sp.]